MGSTNELWSELMTEDEMSFFEELGNRIAAWRQEQDMTQAQLGDALGVTQQVVASYEIGRRRVPASLISTLAETLGVSVVDLLEQTRERSKSADQSRNWNASLSKSSDCQEASSNMLASFSIKFFLGPRISEQ